MLAHKAVITCTDSGGPLEFIRNGDNGLIVEPTPAAMADAMDMVWARQDLAKLWGGASREIYNEMKIGWPNVVEALLK
jgi:glycosyltransferase involved in cell wall biosynthesis